MATTVTDRNGTKVIDVDKKTQNPVEEVRAALAGLPTFGGRKKIFVDMTGLKTGKLPDATFQEMLEYLTGTGFETYVLGVPETLVSKFDTIAREHAKKWKPQPNYLVAGKDSAQRIAYHGA